MGSLSLGVEAVRMKENVFGEVNTFESRHTVV